jgi:hypothetical protein
LKPYTPICSRCQSPKSIAWGIGHFRKCSHCGHEYDPYADLEEPDMADDTPEKEGPSPAKEPNWVKVARDKNEANKERLRKERLAANKGVLRSYRIKP